ncbi:hypothetical protein FF38_14407 [Lucilia cuprina]|uniref:Uncharacterized protein n=1 Tax=Lucilia cuprina TaxID=7375 RepID=A0A0L0CGD6_LUCCU|nr:hypothetical protein FF38_14407 [Lucilia cuprina]
MSAVAFAIYQRNCFSYLWKKLLPKSVYTYKIYINRSLCSSKNDIEKNKSYNAPHPPKDLPEYNNTSCMKHKAIEKADFIPPSVFRRFSSKCETLGPGADKRACYKNTEYYSYHRYSFAALQMTCLLIREQRLKESNIRCIYDFEESDDEKYSCDEYDI